MRAPKALKKALLTAGSDTINKVKPKPRKKKTGKVGKVGDRPPGEYSSVTGTYKGKRFD